MIHQLDFLRDLTPPVDPADATPLEKLARELLRGTGHAGLAARVQVRWNPRMRSTAGMAYPKQSLIKLNPRLREFGDDEIENTIRQLPAIFARLESVET